VCVVFASSLTTNPAGSDPSQHSENASQQTLPTIVGMPHLEGSTEQIQTEPDTVQSDAVPSSRTWPVDDESDSVAVVQSTAGSDGVGDVIASSVV